jgi:predicted phosphodiesterase
MILIIPDIHGRNFWKKAVEENMDKVDRIIFLGDYLDPYPWESITRKEAISNFQEIIDFKSENRDKVVLFVGNHDLAYIDKKNYIVRSRYDSSNARHIEEMFRSHRSFFQLAHEELIGDKRYLFTHAGLQIGWYKKHEKLIGELTVNGINHLLGIPSGIKALCEASWTRGGWDQFGSIVWNDVTDCGSHVNDELPWDRQVFGHSQQEEHPIITDTHVCLDCRKAFILNDDGGFVEC